MIESVLNTQRLVIKPIGEDYADQICTIMQEYPEMGDYMTWAPPESVDPILKSIRSQIKEGAKLFGIFLKEDPEKLIGRVTLRNFVWWERDAQKTSAFLSFWISPECGGKGYGTEMLREVCHYAFKGLKLRKIFAGVFTQNIPSQKLLEKVGFRLIGVSRKHYLKGKVEYDSARYELCVGDFLEAKDIPPVPDRVHITKFEKLPTKHYSLKTEHLHLRNLEVGDAAEIFEALQKHDGFETYLTWNNPQDEEAVIGKIIKTRDASDINLGAFRGGKFIGRGIIRNLRFSQESALKNSAFLGFWLLPPYHGPLELELVQELCRFAFEDLNLRKIFVPMMADNTRMRKTVEQMPFSLMGRLKNHYLKNQVEHDSLRYEMLAEDWKRYFKSM